MRHVYGTPARTGPEAKLVLDFLYNSIMPNIDDGLFQSVFVEYKLENSIPDVIIVQWDPKIAEKWTGRRTLLERVDYRLVHLLYIQGPLTWKQLSHFFPKNLSKTLNRLCSAALVAEIDQVWRLNPLEDIFAVKRILSIEAKLSSSARVLEQALLNTLFSSESYVLTQSEFPKNRSIQTAQEMGIGILSYSKNGLNTLVTAKEQALPQSPISWLLNDVAWKYAQGVNGGYRS